MTILINDLPVEASGFITDGCHKIYLTDIRPIEELPAFWERSCPLRFIRSGDLATSYVPQCEDATVALPS